MSTGVVAQAGGLESRARQSLGSSSVPIYQMVAQVLSTHDVDGDRLVDVGCGSGKLWPFLRHRFRHYSGLDAVRYDAFPDDAEFRSVDFDGDRWSTGGPPADVVTAVETVEHLENPWSFIRGLFYLVKPGGLVVVTTPNQLSLLSLLTLVVKRRFSAFQDAHYPAHRTALLESDLIRAASASGLQVVEIVYSLSGRLPLTAWHYPKGIARVWPRALSDNLALVARRPHA